MDDLTRWLQQQIENQRFNGEGLKKLGCAFPAETGAFLAEMGDLLMADAESKRQIMAIHSRRADVFPDDAGGTFDNCCHGCGYEGICDDPVTPDINDCPILRALARPYTERPGGGDRRPEPTNGEGPAPRP